MLENAKRELESRGVAVLGGYICPDHDRYVSSKVSSGSLSAAERLELCELAVEDSDWLMVDRWAAIYASSTVGFTTIVGHIDKMVNHHIKSPKPIRIVYAFGGDNAMFAFSFVARWSCVCVLRPGNQDYFDEMAGYDSLRNNPRIIFSEDTTAPLDSTSVRKGDLSGLLPKVKDRYLSMQHTRARHQSISDHGIPPSPNVLQLRIEGLWAFQPFFIKSGCIAEQLVDAYQIFCKELQKVFELAFYSVGGFIPPYVIIPSHLREQEEALRKLLATHKVISLDPCLLGTYNLNTTQPSKPLVKIPSRNVLSTDSDTLETKLEQAELSMYTLLTENIPLTDETNRFLTESLPRGSAMSSHIRTSDLTNSVSEGVAGTINAQYHSTINARDFLAGSHEGGTVLDLGGKSLVRAPNMLPYVRPSHHAYIDTTAEMGFSKAVWKLNQEFFRAVGDELFVEDMAPGFQALCEIQGFPVDMRMTELCEWHLVAFGDMVFQAL